MASSADVAKAELDIRTYMLAGGGKGLPKYKTELEQKFNATNRTIKQEGSHCACNSIVLSLLAVIAACGAAFLLAFSGGPNNLQLFAPGIVLGAVSLGLLSWLIVVIVRSIQQRKAQQKEYTDLAQSKLTNEEILEEMQNQETEHGAIVEAMKKFSSDQRQQYMGWVHDQYCNTPNKQPLTDAQKKVLKAFAEFPAEFYHFNLNQVDRVFALQILAHVDPDEIGKGANGEGKALLSGLCKRAVEGTLPLSADENSILARHPVAVSVFVETKEDGAILLAPQKITDIYKAMDENQKVIFLNAMRDKFEALQNAGASTKSIFDTITLCIESTLTRDFVNKFQTAVTSQENSLLAQIARWPDIAATCLYNKPGLKAPKFETALTLAMVSKEQKDLFNTTRVAVQCAYMGDERNKPDMTLHLQELANGSAEFKDSLAVQFFKSRPDRFTDWVLMNEELEKDKKEKAKEARGYLALNILEHMDDAAEKVILEISKFRAGDVGGYPRFNYLTRLLIDQMSLIDIPKNTSYKETISMQEQRAMLNSNGVSDARIKLVARFKLSPIFLESSRSGSLRNIGRIFGLKENDFLPETEKEKWRNFHLVAMLTPNNEVWKQQ